MCFRAPSGVIVVSGSKQLDFGKMSWITNIKLKNNLKNGCDLSRRGRREDRHSIQRAQHDERYRHSMFRIQ